MHRRCKECAWFVEERESRGECFVAPPTVVVESDFEADGVNQHLYAVSRRPWVRPDDFCAQWAE